MKNFYKSFMAIRLRTVSTVYNSKTWFPSENRVRFNGRSQSYYAIGSRCNLGRVIVVRPIRNQLHNCGINRTCVIVKLLWKRPWHFVHGLHIMETFDGAWKLWNYLQFFKIKSPPWNNFNDRYFREQHHGLFKKSVQKWSKHRFEFVANHRNPCRCIIDVPSRTEETTIPSNV